MHYLKHGFISSLPLAIATAILLLSGCGGGGGGGNGSHKDTDPARFRFINAINGTSSVDFLTSADDSPRVLGYGSATEYEEGAGTLTVTFNNAGSPVPILKEDFHLSDNTQLSLLFVGTLNKVQALEFRDQTDPPDDDHFGLRVIDAASNTKQLDIYVVSSAEAVSGLDPTFKNLGYKKASPYVNGNAGQALAIITEKGKKNAIGAAPLQLEGGKNYTLLLLDNGDNDLGTSLLTDE